MTEAPVLNDDFVELIAGMRDAGVEFLIVGAHALAAHGVVRSTGDLDVLVRPSDENSSRVVLALRAFGAPLAAHGVSATDFARAGTVYQLGLPPRRIDILTMISGVTFEQAWADSVHVEVGGVGFRVPSRAALLANKRASGRPKDLEDVRRLELVAAEGPEDS
jgi:hypothetical protein